MKERTKRTSSGESRKRAPTDHDAPAWAIKSPVATQAIRGGAAASRRARGCGGIRTRGAGRDNGSRRLRQIQHQQGGKLHFLPQTKRTIK